MIGGPKDIDGLLPLMPLRPEEDGISADETFADDQIAARLAQKKSAQSRGKVDRAAAEKPKDVLTLQEKIQGARRFLPSGEGANAVRRPFGLRQPPTKRAKRSKARGPATEDVLSLDELYSDIVELLSEAVALQGARDALEEREPESEEEQGEAEKGMDAITLAEQEVLRDLRYAWQSLAVHLGEAHLWSDPLLTFAPLFARISAWPTAIPPGAVPNTHQDCERFLQWVFQPPPLS